jgi:hypothetical protein
MHNPTQFAAGDRDVVNGAAKAVTESRPTAEAEPEVVPADMDAGGGAEAADEPPLLRQNNVNLVPALAESIDGLDSAELSTNQVIDG